MNRPLAPFDPNTLVPDENGVRWVTASQLAALRGVSKVAIVDRIRRYSDLFPTQKIGDNNAKCYSFDEWLAATENENVQNALNGRKKKLSKSARLTAQRVSSTIGQGSGSNPRSGNYTQQQARKAAAQADLAEMQVKQKRGELVEVRKVNEAIVRVADVLLRPLTQLPSRAAEVEREVMKDGVVGARNWLRKFGNDLRSLYAKELERLAIAGEEEEAEDDEVYGDDSASQDLEQDDAETQNDD